MADSGDSFSRREVVITRLADRLCEPESFGAVSHRGSEEHPMPSLEALGEAMGLIRDILFPGYFSSIEPDLDMLRPHTITALDRVHHIFVDEIERGFHFANTPEPGEDFHALAYTITCELMVRLPEIRRLLVTDAQAAMDGDPAAKSVGEVIFCYPSLKAMTHHRVAHELYTLGVPMIPRIIAEMAHSDTGIDIHPGATINERFFIDHGTGTVIGETTVIGKNVRIYQGVTLGARSFPVDGEGRSVKGIPRHPLLEDDVIIYAGATLLGRICIGRGAVIGGNVWLTRDVAAGARIVQGKYQETNFSDGGGI